jgi:hypothetical protein
VPLSTTLFEVRRSKKKKKKKKNREKLGKTLHFSDTLRLAGVSVVLSGFNKSDKCIFKALLNCSEPSSSLQLDLDRAPTCSLPSATTLPMQSLHWQFWHSCGSQRLAHGVLGAGGACADGKVCLGRSTTMTMMTTMTTILY